MDKFYFHVNFLNGYWLITAFAAAFDACFIKESGTNFVYKIMNILSSTFLRTSKHKKANNATLELFQGNFGITKKLVIHNLYVEMFASQLCFVLFEPCR